MKAPASQTPYQAQLLSRLRCLLLDVDGTIVRGSDATPGAGEFFSVLQRTGRSFLVVTNNNSISLAQHSQRLIDAGLDIQPQNILSSAEVAADFLKAQWHIHSVMVLGARALRETLSANGLNLTDENPDCVVVGFDTELCYERLKKACFIIEQGSRWLATHPDVAMPGSDGFWPDCGAITAAISITTGREPDIVLGKPSRYMAQTAITRSGFSPDQIMMVGDRPETDVLLAKQNGLAAALVLTGACDRDQAGTSGADIVLDDLGQLAQLLLAHNGDKP
ncbi:MAG: HAD-IIA family hydrolase [Actinobacteria bacterium]|nr:HAD-IIA family hydrolase [Actinomycetota bacterium]